MQEPVFEVNRDASLQVRLVGEERHKVLVFDDFALDTAPLVAHACGDVVYEPVASKYPGLRSPLPQRYVQSVVDHLYRRLFRTYRVPRHLGLKVINAAYSLITVPEPELEPAQCHPHFDSPSPHFLAIIHYLAEGPFCDTGLFRHRATGFESISEERMDAYGAARDSFHRQHGQSPRRYITDSNEQFELYDRIDYRPNRLAVYSGRLLHSGLVNPEVDIGADPRTGRLTANLFVDFLPPETKQNAS